MILRGTLHHIRHCGSGYWTVATLLDEYHHEQAIVGKLVAVHEGDTLELHGEWSQHARFGRQFKFTTFCVAAPKSATGIVAWLSSALPDVGLARAAAMVKTFGADKIFDVIEESPERLVEVSGITSERASAIGAAYRAKKSQRDRMVYLKQWGLTDTQCAKVIEHYGDDAQSVIENNPYLLTEIHGFGFLTVDAFALRMGVAKDSIERAKAAVRHMLDVAQQAGHVYVPVERLAARCAADLDVPGNKVREAVDDLNGVVVENATGANGQPIRRAYLASLYRSEQRIAARVAALMGDR
jgi:exodeoxyribonuclease V alpha subunit